MDYRGRRAVFAEALSEAGLQERHFYILQRDWDMAFTKVGAVRHVMSATLVMFAGIPPLHGQAATPQLVPGARVRVWYRPYQLNAERGTVRYRSGDTLRLYVPNTRRLEGERVEDVELMLRTIDSLEIGLGRSKWASVRGGLIGLVAGYAAGTIVAHLGGWSADREMAESETAADRRKALARRIRFVGASAGVTLGALRGANRSERWQAVPTK